MVVTLSNEPKQWHINGWFKVCIISNSCCILAIHLQSLINCFGIYLTATNLEFTLFVDVVFCCAIYTKPNLPLPSGHILLKCSDLTGGIRVTCGSSIQPHETINGL